jgi:hypothetical protein
MQGVAMFCTMLNGAELQEEGFPATMARMFSEMKPTWACCAFQRNGISILHGQ